MDRVMLHSTSSTDWQRFLTISASLIVLVAALFLAKAVLMPVVLATFLTLVMSPAVTAFERRGLRRLPSVLVVAALAFSGLAGIGLLVLTQLKNLLADLPRHTEEINEKIAGLRQLGKGSWM